MGFSEAWNKVKGWSNRAWEEATIVNIGNFSYKTLGYILSMPRAALSVGHSIIFDPSMRVFARHMLEASFHLGMSVAASYAQDQIEDHSRTYLLDNEEQAWLSSENLMMGLMLLQWGLWTLEKREQAQEIMQTGILTLESSNAVLSQLPSEKICQDCSSLRFLKGSFRDLITYWTTKLILIEGVRYIPWIGEGLAGILIIYHNGSYIATLIWSPLCGRHIDHNINEHPEFILAQGLTHAGVSTVAVWAIEWVTGIPRQYYEIPIQQLALVGQVVVGAHGEKPALVKHSNRLPKDPVRAYEIGVKSSIDLTLEKSKPVLVFTMRKSREVLLPKVLPIVRPLLNRLPQTPRFPWDKIGNVVVLIWGNKATGVLKFLILPSMLQGQEQFVNNSFVRPHWRGLRDKVIKAMLDLEWVSENYAFRLISAVPGTTGDAVELVMGTPKIITETVLYILRNKTFIAKVAAQRRILEGIHSGPPPETQPDPDAQPLRGQIGKAKIKPLPQLDQEVEEQSQKTRQQPLLKLKIPTEGAMELKLRPRQTSGRLEERLNLQTIKQRSSNDDLLEERIESRKPNPSAFFKAQPKPKTNSVVVYDKSNTQIEFEVVDNDSEVQDELGEGFELVDGDGGQSKTSAFG